MTPEQAELVERSFVKLGPVTSELGEVFYGKLFEIEPGLRSLFRGGTGEQSMRLIHILAYIVSHLRAPRELAQLVRELGRRHVSYGVKFVDYAPFKQALMATLSERLGAEWTEATAHAWAATYDMVAREMRGGAAAEP